MDSPEEQAIGASGAGEPETVLELEDITMSFGSNEVLKGVTLQLRPGRVSALLGANGAGKSTLIKILSGASPDNAGRLGIAGPLDLCWPDSTLTNDVFELGNADSQMLLLARALSQRPKVLVLDEPTST